MCLLENEIGHIFWFAHFVPYYKGFVVQLMFYFNGIKSKSRSFSHLTCFAHDNDIFLAPLYMIYNEQKNLL